jgi:hypothetical protein
VQRRVEHHRVPREIEEFVTEHHPPLRAVRWREELKARLQLAAAFGHVDLEGMDFDRVTGPREFTPACVHRETGKKFQRRSG